MAEYGIVLKLNDIEGPCKLNGFEKALLGQSVSFSSSATRTRIGKGIENIRTSVSQSQVNVVCGAGKWTAELLAAQYAAKQFSLVEILQLGQAVDKNTTALPTPIQWLKLTNAVITAITQGWMVSWSPRVISITFEFEKILHEVNGKSADFTLWNITEGAK